MSAAVPGATAVVNAIYQGTDFAIDYSNSGFDEATKNLATDITINVIVNEIPFDDLGGRTLKDALENRVGKITFPVIQKIVSQNKQAIASKMVKRFSVEISTYAGKYVGEKLNELSDQIIDELVERLIDKQQQIQLKSPGELRVYDSKGQMTGLVNGAITNEIPRSSYDNGAVTIFFPTDSYRYEVVGTANGTYGLMVTSIDIDKVSTFTLADVPISTKVTHLYVPEPDASNAATSKVTMKIDSDGDGTFEEIRSLGREEAGFPWVWVAVAGLSGLLGVLAGAFVVLRHTSRK